MTIGTADGKYYEDDFEHSLAASGLHDKDKVAVDITPTVKEPKERIDQGFDEIKQGIDKGIVDPQGKNAIKLSQNDENSDYDMEAFRRNNPDAVVAPGQHYPDTYKKPNHPTFSNESIYHGKEGAEGGKWEKNEDGTFNFTPGKSNLEHFSPEQLEDYFKRVEPGNKLKLSGDVVPLPKPTPMDKALDDQQRYLNEKKGIKPSGTVVPLKMSSNEEGNVEQASVGEWFGRIFGIGKPEAKPAPEPKFENNPESKVLTDSTYPTDKDAEFAIKNQAAYGQPYEKFFNNEVVRIFGLTHGQVVPDKKGDLSKKPPTIVNMSFKPTSAEGLSEHSVLSALDIPTINKLIDLKHPANTFERAAIENVFARSALAVNRNAIAQLGFNPNRTLIDLMSPNANIAGLTRHPVTQDSSKDHMYANNSISDWGAIVHESIHNGMGKLRLRNEEAKEVYSSLKANGVSEESMVRYIMHKTMGAVESRDASANTTQIEGAQYDFEKSRFSKENISKLNRLIKIAEDEIARKRPGGPR